MSIEADVWLINSTLYIGHDASSLSPARTLSSLYIEPLLSILQAQNPSTAFTPTGTKNGVFDTAPGQTLYLFVDLKTAGATTWPAVVTALEPLRAGGWLAGIGSGGEVIPGPITVIGTGSTPLDLVKGVQPRDYFYDAPLANLDRQKDITAAVSPIASTDFAVVVPGFLGTSFNSSQLDVVRNQITVAHSRGIKVRYWDLPGWPVSTRNAVWRTLMSEGVDLLNVDNLLDAAEF